MCEEEDKDYLMYTLEATAYISASLAAVIYIWETIKKEFCKRRKHKKDKDVELGVIEEDDNMYESRDSSPSDSPNSIYNTVRNRLNSSNSSNY